MRYAPGAEYLQSRSFYNARPAYGLDAGEVDLYATYLAASRKYANPVLLGLISTDCAPSTNKITLDLIIPAYTKHVEVRALAAGRGFLYVKLSTDSFRVRVPVENLSSNAYVLVDAAWFASGPPKDTGDVAGNDENRACYVGLASAWTQVKAEVWVEDGDVAERLKIHALQFVCLAPPNDEELPA